jgi:branched-chain amino acid transport system ATP-binding protein
MSAPLLVADGLVSGYGGAMVLRGVSFSLQPREILAVLGKNGMGKSTLLKTVMGFVPARRGSVVFYGEDATGRAPHLMARAGVAYAPQEFTIFQDLTVEENLRLGATSDIVFKERVGKLEPVFPRMLERLKQRSGTLSGGEQKMLLMSRALLAEPKVMLIDEISEGLQPTMIAKMGEALAAARDQFGCAILIVEQHLSFALSVADRFAVLKLGEIVEEGRAGNPAAAKILSEHLKV